MSREIDSTRERILKAAWTLLESRQGSGVRMTDIAKRAGISRQAVYLHFKTRAELLIATTRYVDEIKDVDQRLMESRAATSGVQRLEAFIEAWCNYIPEIYGIGKALLVMRDTDDEAAAAWDDRMQAVRHGCNAAVDALIGDGHLDASYGKEDAVDILWTMLSVRNWEHYIFDCGWPQDKFVEVTVKLAKRVLVKK